MLDPQILTDDQIRLEIDQYDSFNFGLDDVQAKRAAGGIVPLAMNRAAYRLKDKADQYLAGLWEQAAKGNRVGTDDVPKIPNAISGDTQNIYNLISECTRLLDDSLVPTDGRWMIVPPFFAMILARDLKGTPAFAVQNVMRAATEGGLGGKMEGNTQGLIGGPGRASNGYVADINGFAIYKSPNVHNNLEKDPAKARYHIMFGDSQAITYADQIDQVETLRHPKQFKDIIRGLHVYGAKVVRPECLGVLTIAENLSGPKMVK